MPASIESMWEKNAAFASRLAKSVYNYMPPYSRNSINNVHIHYWIKFLASTVMHKKKNCRLFSHKYENKETAATMATSAK